MLEKLRDRHNQVILFFALFISILFFRLFSLTIVQGNEYKQIADEIIVKKIPITGTRGEIRDRYGRLLAGNKPSFTVQILKNELIDEKINEVSVELLNILYENNEKFTDSFPIVVNGGSFTYTYDKEIDDWLLTQGISETREATDVFAILRDNLDIDPTLNVYEAQLTMQTQYEVYPPISVKTMKFIPEMQKKNFLQKYNLNEKLSAEDAFSALREGFKIPNSYSDIDARKIMIVRNEFKDQGYRQYQPIKIALNVSTKTVATIEEKSTELPGVIVEMEPIRYYPNDGLASHILGYLGKISDSEKEKYVTELGYLNSDLIGKDGIERVLEQELKGIDGAKYVEVDSAGRLINVLLEEKSQKGNTVFLTIDSELQKVAESALEQALQQIQIGGTFESQWGNYKYGEPFKNATSGAVVALDAKNGEVLALASYPSFNPNLFSTGISTKDWNNLQDDNPRDPLSPIPLYNVATRSAVQPGSIYKMITGLAAMEQGLDPKEKLYDNGAIILGGRSFGCWLWNQSKQKHGLVDFYRALEVSCNYYFFDIATGWDYAKGKPLGFNMNVDILLEYTRMFGLGEATGIEISESAYGAPNPKKKLDTIKALLRRDIKAKANDYFQEDILNNKEEVDRQIEQIVSWADENPSRGETIIRLNTLDIKPNKVEALADLAKFSYYNQAKWSTGDTFNLSIGQGEHAYTPLQVANYIAALTNGGYKNDVSVIKKIGTEIIPEETENNKTKIPLNDYNNLEPIKIGMQRVTQGESGSGRAVFQKFPITVMAKTGTAERSGKIQPKDEAEYLRKYLKWIAPSMSLSEVEEVAKQLVKENKTKYKDTGVAMRDAVMLLSDGKINESKIDQFKDDYDNFAWFVSYAPLEDPKIVVVSLIFQGGKGGYAAPVAREIIAEYLGLNKEYDKLNLQNTLTD